jgi:hypothetical protein
MTTPFLSVPIFYYPGATSAQLFTYIANSTTPQVTYSDAAGVVPNTNPVILDTTGAAIVRLVIGAAYDFVLKDQAGLTTIWTANNYTQPLSATSFTQIAIGGALYPQSAAETTAGVTVNTNLLFYKYGDIRRYGGVGDGSTDDSAAFAAGALVSGTYPLTIPYTSTGYKVASPFVLPANGSMIGSGMPQLIATVNGTHICSATGVSGEIIIKGVRFLGSSSSTVPLTGFGGFAAANTGIVTIANCTNVRIEDCEFSTFSNGVTVQGCTRAWIQRNKVDSFINTGIEVAQTTQFSIDFNDVNNCTQPGGVVAYGIQATGNQAGGSPSQFNSISFNRIRNIPSWDAIGTHDVDGLRIVGNDIRNVRHGIDIGHLLNSNVVQNVVISNNYIEGTTTDTWGGGGAEIGAIIIAGFGATPAAQRVQGCTITGNLIRGFFNTVGMVGAGNGAGCIAVINADDVNVTGNSITNCGTASIATATGIWLSGTCNRLNITGNSIQAGTFNRGSIRASSLTFDALTIVGNSGVYTTAATNHVAILSSTGGVMNVNSNPTNSTLPYLESGTTTTNTSNATLAGSGNTATAVTTGSTIPTGFGFVQCTVAGASTGNILTAGIAPGQECLVINASGSNSITMAAAGTSNVADGVSCVIAANTLKRFVWNAGTNLWYH